MKWRAEQNGAFWYCVRNAARVPDSFLCVDEQHAERCARALNLEDAYAGSLPAAV